MARPPKHTAQIRRSIFVSCGLSEKEALLYDIMLAHGAQSAAELEKLSGLKKNTYALLSALLTKKLAQRIKSSNKIVFRPAPPSVLTEIVDKTTHTLAQTKSTLTAMLPELTSTYRISVDKPIVRMYEGQTGLQDVFEDIYGPKQGDNIVWGCGDIERVNIEFPKHLEEKLIPMRMKNKWLAKSIFVNNPAGQNLHARDAEELRDSTLVDGSAYPMPAEIDVYEDKITMISFDRKEFIGLVIQNEAFAQTLRSIFSLAHTLSKKDQSKHHPDEPTKT